MELNQKLISELIDEAKADEVGLWLVISKLRDVHGIVDPALIRSTTLDYVRALLESGQVVAGYYKPDASGFAEWDKPLPEIISRINTEWNDLRREPDIGDIVIFVGRPK